MKDGQHKQKTELVSGFLNQGDSAAGRQFACLESLLDGFLPCGVGSDVKVVSTALAWARAQDSNSLRRFVRSQR